MSKPIPVLILTPSGDVTVPAQDATLTILQNAFLAQLQALLQPITKLTQITISVPANTAIVDQPLTFGTSIQVVVVKGITGGVSNATLKFGTVGDTPIPLIVSEVRDGLSVPSLFLNVPSAGTSGTITLELQAR